MEIQKKYLARMAFVADRFNVPPELIFHDARLDQLWTKRSKRDAVASSSSVEELRDGEKSILSRRSKYGSRSSGMDRDRTRGRDIDPETDALTSAADHTRT